MRFLIDAQLPPALCAWLRDRGHEAIHVFDVDMVTAKDADIADRAEADEAVLVSKDEDFVTLRLPDRFALVRLRCGNATKPAFFSWLEARWDQIEPLLASERYIEVL